MNTLERQVLEDKVLRDAAVALVKADVSHLRSDLKERGVGGRVADRLSEGAVDVFEEAVEVAEDHKGVLTTLLAAVALWFARGPVSSLFSNDEPQDDQDDDFQNYDERARP